MEVFIEANKYGIPAGEYDTNAIVELLRRHSDNKDAVYFIADMMEE
jgi:hypothetical protein